MSDQNKNPWERDDERQRLFLLAYATHCSITAAADAAAITRVTHYDWLRKDPTYAAAFNEIRQMAADMLEDVVVDRAVNGWKEPVFQNGGKVGEITKYDSTLLIFRLNCLRPEYRTRHLQHSGKDGEPAIPLSLVDAIVAEGTQNDGAFEPDSAG